MTGERYIGVSRVSNLTRDTQSPERQKAKIDARVLSEDGRLVGWADDLNVSGDVSPFDRPELGYWLANPHMWDVLVFPTVDRVSRSVADFAKLLDWADEHGKRLLCTDQGIDFADPMVGRPLATMLSMFAQMELIFIRKRARDGRADIQQAGKFGGGKPPFGYRKVRHPSGKGWALEIDPKQEEVLWEMARRVLGGEAMYSIAVDFNQRGIPAPRSDEWRSTAIRQILNSDSVRGYYVRSIKVKDANTGRDKWITRTVMGDDGRPLQRAPEILDAETHRMAKRELRIRAENYEVTAPRSSGITLLHHVCFCGICDGPMPRNGGSGKGRVSYRCGGAHKDHGLTISLPLLDKYVTSEFLAQYGAMAYLEQVNDPGENHEADLRDLEKRLRQLYDDRAAGAYAGDFGRAEFIRQSTAMNAELERVKALPSREPRTYWIPSGRTVAQEWSRRAIAGRNALLKEYGARAIIGPAFSSGPKWNTDRLTLTFDVPDIDRAELETIAMDVDAAGRH